MKKLMAIAAMIAAFGLGGAAAFAASTDKPANPGGGNDGQVCPANDSGHISGGSPSVTATAPDGKLISSYCVKAGSANQGLGPEFVTVDPPQKTVTISHSSGKDVSHYSLTYVDEGQTTTTETEPPTTTTETEPPTTTTETEPPTTTTETVPARVCPDGRPPTPGEGAFDPNDDCARPPTTTTTTATTPETTTSETTTPDPVVEQVDEEEQQDDPPVTKVKSAQAKSAKAGPKAVAAPASASKPSKAAQPAPLTP